MRYDDITEDLLYEETNNTQNNIHPIIEVQVASSKFSVVIDSGSPFNIISTQAFEKCKTLTDCPTLPVKKIVIQGALAGKKTNITQQTQIEISCLGISFPINFVIVPILTTEMIFGMEFLRNFGAILNFNDSLITFHVQGKSIKVRFDQWLTPEEQNFNIFCLNQDDNYVCARGAKFPLFTTTVPNLQNDHIQADIHRAIQQKIEQIPPGNEVHKERLSNILKQNTSVFYPKPGTIKNFQYKFRVKPHQKFAVKSYPIPQQYRDKVKQEIEQMIRDDVIEPAASPYNNPLHIVEKSNGNLRLVLDLRQINTIIIPENDRPQTLQELLQNFHDTCIFSSIDLRSSFWQVQLHPECRQYTAFLCFGVTYVFKKLPYGLCTSSAAFIRSLDAILPPDLKDKLTIYIDDILIAERSWDEHNYILNRLLKIFKENGITVNLEKSQFGQAQIKFLGHSISDKGISPDPDKLEAIREFPTPRNKKDVRAFLGLINFYKRFIQIDMLATPRLNALTGKKTTWCWDEQTDKEFKVLKDALLHAPILRHPDMTKDFSLSTDSSLTGLAAHLFQEETIDGVTHTHSIAFASRGLSPSEKNYSITEIEAMAIVFAFSKFKYFLTGKHTTIYTDHRALQFLMSSKLVHNRLKRWALFLQEFRFTIVYVPGAENIIADTLSRAPVGRDTQTDIINDENNFSIAYIRNVPFENFITNSLQHIAAEQDQDLIWHDIKMKWKDKSHPAIRNFYTVRNNILFKRSSVNNTLWVLCIPEAIVNKLIWYIHLSYAHYGARKIYKHLRQTCYFDNMEKRIRKVTAHCHICQKAKSTTMSYKAQIFPIIPTKLKHLGAVDLLGPLVKSYNGFSYILIAVELTSKFVCLTPLRRATAKTVSAALVRDFLKEVGNVQRIISDNGPQFRSKTWNRTLARHRIRPIFISRYWPSANPAERVIKEVNKLCRIYCYNKQQQWDRYIKIFQHIMNSLPHESTSLPPIVVLKNKYPADRVKQIIDFPRTRIQSHREIIQLALRNIQLAADKRKRQQTGKFVHRQFSVGQKVLLKNHPISHKKKNLSAKFSLIYKGPYKVKRIAHPNAIELETIRTRKSLGLHHIAHIKPFVQ